MNTRDGFDLRDEQKLKYFRDEGSEGLRDIVIGRLAGKQQDLIL